MFICVKKSHKNENLPLYATAFKMVLVDNTCSTSFPCLPPSLPLHGNSTGEEEITVGPAQNKPGYSFRDLGKS